MLEKPSDSPCKENNKQSDSDTSSSEQEFGDESVNESLSDDWNCESTQKRPCRSTKSTTKKEGGYTYWKRDIPDAHMLPSCSPQRIEHLVAAPISPASSTVSMSAWNALGTWEEKNTSKLVASRLPIMLNMKELRVDIEQTETVVVQLKDIDVKTCESTICFVRGKPKFGYDLALDGSWSLEGQGRSGSITVRNLTDHDLCPDVLLSPDFECSDFSIDENADAVISDPPSHDTALWTASSSRLQVVQRELGKLLKSIVTDIGTELTTRV